MSQKSMLKDIALTLLLAGLFAPLYARNSTNSDHAISVTIEDYEFGRAFKDPCEGKPEPEDFACALVFNFDPRFRTALQGFPAVNMA
jgi:hypothetical protein